MSKPSLTVGQESGNGKGDSKESQVQTIATLSSSISHELKNYLAAIHICAELSESKLRDIRKKAKEADYLIGNLQLQIKGVVTGKPSREGF